MSNAKHETLNPKTPRPQALGQNVPQEVFVYYREGSHAAAPFNMSEWRVLGTVLVHHRP